MGVLDFHRTEMTGYPGADCHSGLAVRKERSRQAGEGRMIAMVSMVSIQTADLAKMA